MSFYRAASSLRNNRALSGDVVFTLKNLVFLQTNTPTQRDLATNEDVGRIPRLGSRTWTCSG
eukprot:2312806-Rhodomonas_salina.1